MREKFVISLAFMILITAMAFLTPSTASSGTSSFNVEWFLLVSNFVLFLLLGYSIRMILESGLPRLQRSDQKKTPWITAIITVLALFVALYRLSHKNPPKILANVSGPDLPNWQITGFKEDVVRFVYHPLPDILYLVPIALFVILALTARRRKVPGGEIAESFDPGLTYESVSGTPAERVVKMYKNVVAGLVRKGYPYQRSWTHWEHEAKLREIFPDLGDLDVLTRIFERAKYAGRLKEDEVRLARESYDRLMSFLR
jgi:hypothetical protein